MVRSGKEVLLLCGSSQSAKALLRYSDLFRQFCSEGRVRIYEDVAACKARLEKSDDLVFISSDLRQEDRANILDYCHKKDIRIYLIPNFHELFCAVGSFSRVGDIPVLQVRRLRQSFLRRAAKRMFDFVCSLAGLIMLWPLFLSIALAIKLDSPGPVFYIQHRAGLRQELFKIIKFRTMHRDAEKHTGPVLAVKNDPRVTRVGRILRTTRLDELPQLINVLAGHMSIVGPRPERPFFTAQHLKQIPQYEYRFYVKPGITGMAQVCGRYDTPVADKLVYDLLYISKSSIITDVIIILKTIKVVFSQKSSQGAEEQVSPAESVS